MRVLCVEDDPWIRESLAALLPSRPGQDAASSVELAGAFGSAEEALTAVAQGLDFDLGLIDLGLPGMGGVELIGLLRVQRPNAVLVAFTIFEDAPRVFAALRAGARGYLLKTTPPSRLVPALEEAAAGGAPMSPSIARVVIDAFVTSAGPTATRVSDAASAIPRPTLTPRETEVLRLLARGLTYPDIARVLDLGLGTVQGYVKIIYHKLEVCSKAEAAVAAIGLGLV